MYSIKVDTCIINATPACRFQPKENLNVVHIYVYTSEYIFLGVEESSRRNPDYLPIIYIHIYKHTYIYR